MFSLRSRKGLVRFDNQIKRSLKELPFLFEKKDKRRTGVFLAVRVDIFNTLNAKEKAKMLATFMKCFGCIIEPTLKLSVFFTIYKNSEAIKEKVMNLAEDNHFDIQPTDLS